MENTIRTRTKTGKRWMDWTNPLRRTFEGESREKVLRAWEDHFRGKRIRTRRIKGRVETSTRAGKGQRGYDWIKLQIWID